MKRWKKAAALAAALLTAAMLSACSKSGGGSKSVDVAATADELNSTVITSDQLTETKSDMLGSIYFFEDGQVTDSKVYMSSGATADEICIVACKDEAAAKDAVELFRTRVKNQSDLYASYNEGEVSKLDKAIIQSGGNYACLVVCDDYDKAQEILKNAGF